MVIIKMYYLHLDNLSLSLSQLLVAAPGFLFWRGAANKQHPPVARHSTKTAATPLPAGIPALICLLAWRGCGFLSTSPEVRAVVLTAPASSTVWLRIMSHKAMGI